MIQTFMPTNLDRRAKPLGWLAHNHGALYWPDLKATSAISNPHRIPLPRISLSCMLVGVQDAFCCISQI